MPYHLERKWSDYPSQRKKMIWNLCFKHKRILKLKENIVMRWNLGQASTLSQPNLGFTIIFLHFFFFLKQIKYLLCSIWFLYALFNFSNHILTLRSKENFILCIWSSISQIILIGWNQIACKCTINLSLFPKWESMLVVL